MLRQPDGTIKPFYKFRDHVLAVNEKYNLNYLKAEYEMAHSSSLMAAKWKQISQNPKEYYLQYRTVGDERVRASHAALNRITLPADDPFWDFYYQPNAHGCRCTTVRVNREHHKQSNAHEAMQLGNEAMTIRYTDNSVNTKATSSQQIFKFNAGKQAVIFPPKHPYYAYQKLVDEKLRPLINKRVEKGKQTAKYDNGGRVYENIFINTQASDYNDVNKVANLFAKQGQEATILPKVHYKDALYKLLFEDAYERKCPDLKIDGKFYELESYTGTWNNRKLANMFDNGLKQSDCLIIDVRNSNCTIHWLKKRVSDRIRNGDIIKEVWAVTDNGLQQLF